MPSRAKIRYKLTDENCETLNHTKWGEGVSHKTSGEGKLCGSGWLHVYTSPELALFLNPTYEGFKNPQLWKCQVSGLTKTDHGLKEGWTEVKTVKQLAFVTPNTTQRVTFGILCAKEVFKDKEWNMWADKWLSGEDRSRAAANAAYAAAYAAANTAAYAAAYAAYAAANAVVNAAANAAYAYAHAYAAAYAYTHAYAAANAYAAVNVAAHAAAHATPKINLAKIAKEAMNGK